jgi:hypothetical protein
MNQKLDDKTIDSIEKGPNEEYYNIYIHANNDLNLLIENISDNLVKSREEIVQNGVTILESVA